MRERTDRQPVAGNAQSQEEALRWATDTAMRRDAELLDLQQRFDIRGDVLCRVKDILDVFTDDTLAMKALRGYFAGREIED